MANRTTLARGKRRLQPPTPNPWVAAWAKAAVPRAPLLFPSLFPPSAQVRRAATIRAAQAAAKAPE